MVEATQSQTPTPTPEDPAKQYIAERKAELEKAIVDCFHILCEMDPCKEIKDPIEVVLHAKQRELSFINYPLPKITHLEHHDRFSEEKLREDTADYLLTTKTWSDEN